MKKMILSLVFLLTLGASSFANNTEGVNQKVSSSFAKDFANAKEVKWDNGKEFSKVTFNLNGQVMFAYYSNNGEKLAISRNILSSQLPINLLNELKTDFSEFWITDLFEIATGNETSYYVTIENADARVVLKSTNASSWELYKKDKKDAQ